MKLTNRELIIMLRMFLISLFDEAKLKARQKDRISELLKIIENNINEEPKQ